MSSFGIIVFTLIVIVLVKVFKWYSARKEFFAKIQHVPAPPAFPVIGNGLDFKNAAALLPGLMKYQSEYGLSYQLKMGPDNYIVTSDPKFIEFLTTSQTQIKKSVSYRFLDSWLGTGLLTASNPKWKIHRRLLTPTFHFKILEDCLPIFHSNAQNLINHLQKSMGQEIDIHEFVILCSLDVICESAMGVSINALKFGNSSEYVKSVKYMGNLVIDRTFSFWRQIDALYHLSPGYQQEKKYVDYLHSFTDKMIRTKRRELEEKSTERDEENNEELLLYGKKKLAFLDMLLRCSLSDYEIRQEVDTFMFAGHDTVSSGISFTLFLLSKHQDIQEKVYQEILDSFVDEEVITMEMLNKLTYLEMVIKESMRLYPPVPMIARELTEDVIFDGHVYPKGLTTTMFTYGLHRNSEIYPDPEKFDPERFSHENSSKRSIFSYLPFSAGPRNCLGQKFAMLEMKSLISSFLKMYRILEVPNFEIFPVAETVLKALNGIYIKIEKR